MVRDLDKKGFGRHHGDFVLAMSPVYVSTRTSYSEPMHLKEHGNAQGHCLVSNQEGLGTRRFIIG